MKTWPESMWGEVGKRIDCARDLTLDEWRAILGLPDEMYWEMRNAPREPTGPGLVVTKVDHKRGIVTIEAVDAKGKR